MQTHFKDFSSKKRPLGAPCSHRTTCGIVLPCLFPHIQTLRHHRTQSLAWAAQVQLALVLGISHMMMTLQASRVQDLWCHGSFHWYFKGKLGMPGSVWQSWSPWKQPLIGQCLILWGWSQNFLISLEVRDIRNMECLWREATGSKQSRPKKVAMCTAIRAGLPKHLVLPSGHWVPWMPHMGLQDLMFVLLNFGLAMVWFLLGIFLILLLE
jgi:hypothetical protein